MLGLVLYNIHVYTGVIIIRFSMTRQCTCHMPNYMYMYLDVVYTKVHLVLYNYTRLNTVHHAYKTFQKQRNNYKMTVMRNKLTSVYLLTTSVVVGVNKKSRCEYRYTSHFSILISNQLNEKCL